MKNAFDKIKKGVADTMHAAILVQQNYIETRKDVVLKHLIEDDREKANIAVKCSVTANGTLQYLLKHFEQFTGCTYKSYLKGLEVIEVYNDTPLEKLGKVIFDFIDSKES
mgnify:CR=1 FL=1|tara:strand:+ start:874 stop:1203 length:330 start_codon:yes stop_codon:yes gene_type:complete